KVSFAKDIIISILRKVLFVGRQSCNKTIDVPDTVIRPIAKTLSTSNAPELSGHLSRYSSQDIGVHPIIVPTETSFRVVNKVFDWKVAINTGNKFPCAIFISV